MIPRSNCVLLFGVLTDVAYENINNVLFFLTYGFLIIDMQHLFPKQMEIRYYTFCSNIQCDLMSGI